MNSIPFKIAQKPMRKKTCWSWVIERNMFWKLIRITKIRFTMVKNILHTFVLINLSLNLLFLWSGF